MIRHTQLPEFINSENGSTQMEEGKQLPEFINSENDISAATDGRGVVHKERGEEQGTSPHSPLKEKEGQKEISATPNPTLHAGARVQAQGMGVGRVDFRQSDSFSVPVRPGVSLRIDDEEVRYSQADSVELAMAALRLRRIDSHKGRTYHTPRVLRKVLHQIGDEVFREVLIQQLHENRCDGEPRSRAAAFMAKLYAVRDELKGGAA